MLAKGGDLRSLAKKVKAVCLATDGQGVRKAVIACVFSRIPTYLAAFSFRQDQAEAKAEEVGRNRRMRAPAVRCGAFKCLPDALKAPPPGAVRGGDVSGFALPLHKPGACVGSAATRPSRRRNRNRFPRRRRARVLLTSQLQAHAPGGPNQRPPRRAALSVCLHMRCTSVGPNRYIPECACRCPSGRRGRYGRARHSRYRSTESPRSLLPAPEGSDPLRAALMHR